MLNVQDESRRAKRVILVIIIIRAKKGLRSIERVIRLAGRRVCQDDASARTTRLPEASTEFDFDLAVLGAGGNYGVGVNPKRQPHSYRPNNSTLSSHLPDFPKRSKCKWAGDGRGRVHGQVDGGKQQSISRRVMWSKVKERCGSQCCLLVSWCLFKWPLD